MRHHAGHGSTDRHRRRPDRTRRPPVGDGARAGRVARARAGRPCCGRRRDSPGSRCATPATWRSSRGSGRTRTRGPRTGRRSARSCRVSATSSRRRSAGLTAGRRGCSILGGDCTAHAGAMAGLRAARPDARYAIAWFDAHGDFNTPDTTPSGNVWGMPFAMLCGRGDPDLVAAADGPTVMEQDAALFGGQVLDETESRMLAASRVAQFRGRDARRRRPGVAAVEGWARSVATRVDGIYIAFDMDCLDGAERLGGDDARARRAGARDGRGRDPDPRGGDAGRRVRADRGDAGQRRRAEDRGRGGRAGRGGVRA